MQDIVIRDMRDSDAQRITDAEIAQGWGAEGRLEKYEMRLQHQQDGLCRALVAEYKGDVAGYIHVYPESQAGPFAGKGIPELVDFGVLEKYRRRGIGNALMDAAEAIASGMSDTVCLGVGLHAGYGSAQRMYIRRGYMPDGTGVWWRDQVCPPYSDCCNDDDLVLYFSKSFR